MIFINYSVIILIVFSLEILCDILVPSRGSSCRRGTGKCLGVELRRGKVGA